MGLHIETILMVCLKSVCTCKYMYLSKWAGLCCSNNAPDPRAQHRRPSALSPRSILRPFHSCPPVVGDSGIGLPLHWEAAISTGGFQSNHDRGRGCWRISGRPSPPARSLPLWPELRVNVERCVSARTGLQSAFENGQWSAEWISHVLPGQFHSHFFYSLGG